MNFDNFKSYGEGPQNAFETFCTQLFERYLRRKYVHDLVKFRVVNGAGGDGGIEAYGELKNGDIIAVQAKWFPENIDSSQITQIRSSVETALNLRKKISEYIICVPRSLNSIKMGKGGIPVANTEEYRVDQLTIMIQSVHATTNFTWWFEQNMQNELMEGDNEGMQKFWFEKELVTIGQLKYQFDLEKAAWIDKRYIPELHGPGVIQSHIEQILYSQPFRKTLQIRLAATTKILQNIIYLISRFIDTLPDNHDMVQELKEIHSAVGHNLAVLLPVNKAIQEGFSIIPAAGVFPMLVSNALFEAIVDLKPTDRQLGLQRRLTDNFGRLRLLNLTVILTEITAEANQFGRLFLGNSGTGKTHALSNTVDIRLNKDNAPAIIIRAIGAPCTEWSLLLKKALDLDNWNTNEMLSALETLAVRADHLESKKLKEGDEVKKEFTKVIICVDGLEEDTEHWTEWYERMRESVVLMKRYKRVCFVYTARPYFQEEAELPTDAGFRVIEIPREGDVPVQNVIEQYFSPEHFNIKVEPKSLIRGIDSLYALRLFCELYRGKTLNAKNEILTAEGDLLNKKIDRMEREFRKIKDAGGAHKPIMDAISAIAEVFYNATEIEHDQLFGLLEDGPLGYLEKEDVEKIIEFLVNYGFLNKIEIPNGKGLLKKTKVTYNLTYQSIMELIMSEKYVDDIVRRQLNVLPAHLFSLQEKSEGSDVHLINERIVQQIVNTLFHEHNLLIGRDNLAEGLNSTTIHQLQTKALIQAPSDVAASFKHNINELYFKDPKSRYFVFSTLIFPSAISATNYFGAEYLHEILMQQPTAVDREKVWLGWDRKDIHQLESESRLFYKYDLRNVLDPYRGGDLFLPQFSLHNEYPLIFGWALATLDQSLRERLRTTLTGWALCQPHEFRLLLDKLFNCNDPQIKEDLAAIALGVASRIKDKQSLKELANWALKNIFKEPVNQTNIIVRLGFRAVVEKAYLEGVVTEELAAQSRPRRVHQLVFIPIDRDALGQGGEEIYPIVHDLAWYVIKKSFNDFLNNNSIEKETKPKNDEQRFLKVYLEHLGLEHLSVYSWAISAAIAYMKSLGFSRIVENGNGYTDGTHGSKSEVFTQEEKYTWLAVHYLQAYLSDYLPLEKSGEYIDDYMKITNIDNPAEFLPSKIHPEMPDIEDNWIIKEPLAPEMQGSGTADDQVKMAVESEPVNDFSKWLEYSDTEFRSEGSDKEWLSIFNYTSVHDSKAYINSSVDIRGIIIEKGQTPALLDLVQNHEKRSYFVESIDGMVGSPDTDTYSNPSDVVWMKWIGEIEQQEDYYLPPDGEKKQMLYTVTSVTKQTVDGEQEVYIPSKTVRNLMGINEMSNQLFLNEEGNIMAINHILTLPNYDRQEMTLVLKNEFLSRLDACGKEIVWFVDLFRSKNALNDEIKSNEHPMKTRKYIVWYSDGKLNCEKFWDARFSNQRDKDPNEPEEDAENDWRNLALPEESFKELWSEVLKGNNSEILSEE